MNGFFFTSIKKQAKLIIGPAYFFMDNKTGVLRNLGNHNFSSKIVEALESTLRGDNGTSALSNSANIGFERMSSIVTSRALLFPMFISSSSFKSSRFKSEKKYGFYVKSFLTKLKKIAILD